jgi:hypothetical protein
LPCFSFKTLFGIDLGVPRPAPSLERLILLWNQIEQKATDKLKGVGIDAHPGKQDIWRSAVQAGIIKREKVALLNELKVVRNKQVHSTSIDHKQVAVAVQMAEELLSSIV